MLNKVFLGLLLSASLTSHANLVDLSNQQLNEMVGQGGADLNWTLSLNHQYATDMSKTSISRLDRNGNPLEVFYVLSPDACGTNKLFCRLAIAPNNHVDANNNKKWLVFKGIQGTVQIDKFSLDGETIINHLDNAQTALKITFYDDKPIKIRNLGFDTLSIETGKDGQEGYANISTYSGTFNTVKKLDDGTTTTVSTEIPQFDAGAEKGFMGLNVHGNLHMSGNLKIFSYNCNGTGRC